MKKLSTEQRKALLKKCQINPLESVTYPPIALSLGNNGFKNKQRQ